MQQIFCEGNFFFGNLAIFLNSKLSKKFSLCQKKIKQQLKTIDGLLDNFYVQDLYQSSCRILEETEVFREMTQLLQANLKEFLELIFVLIEIQTWVLIGTLIHKKVLFIFSYYIIQPKLIILGK